MPAFFIPCSDFAIAVTKISNYNCYNVAPHFLSPAAKAHTQLQLNENQKIIQSTDYFCASVNESKVVLLSTHNQNIFCIAA